MATCDGATLSMISAAAAVNHCFHGSRCSPVSVTSGMDVMTLCPAGQGTACRLSHLTASSHTTSRRGRAAGAGPADADDGDGAPSWVGAVLVIAASALAMCAAAPGACASRGTERKDREARQGDAAEGLLGTTPAAQVSATRSRRLRTARHAPLPSLVPSLSLSLVPLLTALLRSLSRAR